MLHSDLAVLLGEICLHRWVGGGRVFAGLYYTPFFCSVSTVLSSTLFNSLLESVHTWCIYNPNFCLSSYFKWHTLILTWPDMTESKEDCLAGDRNSSGRTRPHALGVRH
jgi:hypothetical protein